jgi:hypothetical protein
MAVVDPEHELARRLAGFIRDVPDYPKPGIVFKDITPLLADAASFRDATNAMALPFAHSGVTHVVAIESRGFIVGAPVAQALGVGFIPVRKPGKLPSATRRETYGLGIRHGRTRNSHGRTRRRGERAHCGRRPCDRGNGGCDAAVDRVAGSDGDRFFVPDRLAISPWSRAAGESSRFVAGDVLTIVRASIWPRSNCREVPCAGVGRPTTRALEKSRSTCGAIIFMDLCRTAGRAPVAQMDRAAVS